MSRIGRLPVTLPKGVKAEIAGQLLKVEGPKGKVERRIRPEVKVELANSELQFSRANDERASRAFHGMERALVNNMVLGVAEGFNKELELIGVGYRADMTGSNMLNLALGYSHQIDFPLPQGIKGSVIKDGRQTFIRLEGIDKQLVGQVAAQIRSLRKPEPYQGKGVRYKGEVIKLKAGKAGKK
jgi:large subunit ribosomal protein L6